LADPASFRDTIAEREAVFAELHELEPPYIVGGDRVPPPISEWPRRNAGGVTAAVAGEVLQGGPGAPGVVTGRARIVLDPIDAPDLEPDDILVAPTTDPSWASLFLAVGGVVVNVGAVGSHAAIVSRELGVPCAVSVHDATSRIPEGATITVDGSTGTVTVVGV
jgi:pyruvate,water dikinase